MRTAISVALLLSALPTLAETDSGRRISDPTEIIVTGTKRERALRDLAQSAVVLSGAQLENTGTARLDDYWRSIPSLNVYDAPFGGNTIIIRGLSDSDNFQQNQPLNALYLDDTAITHVEGLFTSPTSPRIVDVDRIEVFRGPQGTIQGASSMGGTISVVSREPVPDELTVSAEMNVSGTAHGGTNAGGSATLNLPIGSGGSALRLAMFHQDDDGWIDDIGLGETNINGDRSLGGRLSYLFAIPDRFELLARVFIEDRTIGGYDYQDPVGRLGLPTRKYERVLLSDESRVEESTVASLRLRRFFDWGEIVSTTSWHDKRNRFDFDWSVELELFFGVVHEAPHSFDHQQEDVSQEIRFVSNDTDGWSWLAGAYYLDQDFYSGGLGVLPDFGNACPGCPPPVMAGDVVLDLRDHQAREEWAVFGEVSWKFLPGWSFTLGGRWFDIDRSLATAGFAIGQQLDDNVRGGDDGFVPKISLSVEIAETVMAYALFSQGFRAGQFNNAPARDQCGAEPVLDSDELRNYELGIRARSQDGRIAASLSAFHIDWSDIQTGITIPSVCPFVFKANSGQATSNGLEADFSVAVSDGFSLYGGLGFNRSILVSGNPSIGAEPGARIPNVAKVTANLAARLSFDLGENTDGFVRGDVSYVGERFSTFAQTTAEMPVLDGYALFDVGIGAERDGWRVELFVDNLFDEVADIFCCRALIFSRETTINRPRTIGLRTRFDF